MGTEVLSVIGTRPEAIKMAPVVTELGQYPEAFERGACLTGQSRQMLDQVLERFGIQSGYDLGVMTANHYQGSLTANLYGGLDEVVRKARPEWVLTQGDTTTVMLAALTAFYHRIESEQIE